MAEKSSHDSAPPTTDTQVSKPPEAAIAEDSDPDFDDLDDVLDQFSAASAAKPTTTKQADPLTAPSASGPGRPSETLAEQPIPHGQGENESQEEFMTRLTAEMESVMSSLSTEPAASASSTADIAQMGRELEEFTRKMEAEGVKPEDLLRAVLGEEEGRRLSDAAKEDRDKARDTLSQPKTTAAPSKAPQTGPSTAATASSFEDTIRRTLNRMEDSSASATAATQQSSGSNEEAMLAEMLKSLGSSADPSNPESDDQLSQLFLNMMQQLTNKDMLYEPMKELSTKYPDWLKQNKSKLPAADVKRFENQQVIVKEIVDKFEEKGYTDEDAGCREYIWERMQKMQAEGAPPEELVANPIPGMGLPGGMGQGMEEGCPTQ